MKQRRIFMKRTVVLSIAAALFSLTPVVSAADKKTATSEATLTIALDVAMDASTARADRRDWSITGPVRGDTVILNGLLYASGSVPEGDATASFAMTDDGRLGTL